MLRGIPPLLTPDLLHALAAMGHGDTIAIVDANFPASSVGRRVVELPGATSAAVLEAVLQVMPLDDFALPCALTMEMVGHPQIRPPAVEAFVAILERYASGSVNPGHLERMQFYERARHAFAVVRTGDRQPYANVLLVKGVIGPD
ncbi:MAG: RbsD/FucU domain-containing protein [Casimicrobiaceae bacterium]